MQKALLPARHVANRWLHAVCAKVVTTASAYMDAMDRLKMNRNQLQTGRLPAKSSKLLDVLYKNTASDSTSKDTDKSHLPKSGKEYEKVEAKPMTSLSEIKKSMCDILENNSDEDGKMLLSEMGRLLTKTYPDFDPRNYGRERKLSEFIKKMPEFKVDKVYFEGNTRPPLAYIMHQSKND